MKILITGGSGTLGSHLIDYCKSKGWEVFSPTHEEMDITSIEAVDYYFYKKNWDMIIHSAAYTNTLNCENLEAIALESNVVGTLNLVRCASKSTKFIYISSEYVFSGNKGNYTPKDRLDPINVYGKTKAAAEYIVSVLPNYQIIRVPFIRKKYDKVFNNQICTRYFIDEIADKIMFNAMFNSDKIVHIAPQEAKSLYDHYVDKGIKVEGIPIPEDIKGIIPRNTSLKNTSMYHG